MSEEEGSGGSEAGCYVPPIALLKSNGSDGSSAENTKEAKSDASPVAADTEKSADEKHDEDAKDEDLSISEEPLKPAAESPAAPATDGGGSAGGLFAGLSLSPSASGNLKSAATTAPPSSSVAETESTEHQPSSRAVTPVHSNAAPPTTTSPESAKEKVDSLDNENTTQANKTPLVKRGSAGSSTSEKAPPASSSSKTNHKPKSKTTTTIDLMLQVTILPPSSKKTSSSPTTLTNTDTTLRLLRKFHTKSAPSIPQHAGGTQPVSWYGWMFGPSVETAGNEDPALKCFHDFTEALGVVSEGEDGGDENVASSTSASDSNATGEEDVIVESILGHKDDSPSKARDTLASFIQLVHCWCLTSAQVAEALLEKGSGEDGAKSQDGVVTEELLSLAISTASSLVAHGCLDDLYVNIGHADKSDGSGGSAAERAGETQEIDEILDSTKAVNVLSESIFAADLSLEQIELAALKFLLTTGCRVAACSSSTDDNDGEEEENKTVMEPMLRGSHLLQTFGYTESKPNRTTAKAALQQLVISVFVRLERAIEQLKVEEKVDPSAKATKSVEGTFASQDHRDAYLVDRQAFQSRILALELLLHILKHKSGGCILYAGPEFHYAIRQYLCTSLLKNTTSPDTTIVELSLRLFVPLIRNFRSLLKTEIEAFVTNVFFVILDSKNSTIQHKLLVITLFEEICSDATTLAEIFLNYDCDLSAVDLFQRIVNALGKVARVGLTDATGSGASGSSLQFVAGAGATRAEKMRQDHRELRLAAMNALRQVLASLHSSIATPVKVDGNGGDISVDEASLQLNSLAINGNGGEKTAHLDVTATKPASEDAAAKKTLVEMYDSKKKRREEESQAALKFNQKPTAGLKYASEKGHLDADDPVDVAKYLLRNKDLFDKAQIGDFLGREKEWQGGFALKVLRAYGEELDFKGMDFDEAIRYYLSGFRLPVFAARYTDQNSKIFPTPDAAFILAFSIIMLNTDLHNPAIKEDRKMTIKSFQRMNSGVCDGGDFPDEMLEDIFNRIKNNPISLKEDDDARESAGIQTGGAAAPSALSTAGDFFFGNHYVDEDNARKTNYQKEGDQIVRDTESMLRQRRKATKQPSSKKSLRDSLKKRASVNFVGTADTGLKDEYVTPMFDVTWGPALAVFSTAIESANITESALSSIATDEEMDLAVDNAASVIEVSLNGFQLAICIAGICGNDTARDAYVRALYNFTRLGKGRLLSSRHIHCVQALLRLGIDDGELLATLGSQSKSDRKKRADDDTTDSDTSSEVDDANFPLEEEMDKKGIDEANAKAIYGAISLNLVDSIFQRSSYLSRPSLKDFVYQLCRVSRMEISGYGGHVGSDANDIDLTNDHYMKHHTLVSDSTSKVGVGGSQPAIYSLQKLVEVTQFNMESRPRLIFADIWGTISTHLTSTALHEEAAVAMFAVDSLRQLSMQFLNREELGVFEFQRRFLKPLETIMSRSTHVSVKEHLLSSVEQLILIYGFDEGAESSEKATGGQKRTHQGTLRSGWRSVLLVLGAAGLDNNEAVASQGFQLLSAQIQQWDSNADRPMSLLTEHFVDLVNALLLYVSGQSQNLSSKSLESLMQLSELLAEGRVSVSSTRNKTSTSPSFHNDELELWWPILLGLSKRWATADMRERSEENGNSSPQHGELQTLQLIFRGILVPALEFEEMDGNSTSGYAPELLPPKFVYFITAPPSSAPNASDKGQREWIGTTFDHLIDGCVSICLKSMEAFGNDSWLKNCLLSDSGHLAVRGLRRLQQFVTKDLDLKDVTDDTWATGNASISVPESEGSTDEEKEQLKQEHKDAMDERYIGCNAAMVIGSLLTTENIVKSMGVQWYIFLMSGLGKGIKDWERAAEILSSSGSQESSSQPSPPHYLENVLYARRWMTKFIISLTAQTDAATLENAQFQHVLKEETESLLHAFLKREADESCSAVDMRNVSKMVTDILEGFNGLSDEKLSTMKWLSPVLSTCIQTNNTSLRTSVQILLTRLTQQK
ncbi:ARF guanine nucleotide exchange factor [Skeletonema marinoi]|uniref:ARF guanine nucleotide exchange factor n=1 Tax=Skeletonema marinoi TaxID=267567 RepID=A0AAD8YMB0_9STRA|nr:ARF guanine nucleotide exchange factor [Skeletonema marinoi]